MAVAPRPHKCPDAGAPKWVTTFGDLMSLLLCFFVLLLSFSEMDRAKYKQVAGSLEKAFGVQRKSKSMEPPRGVRMIAKDFDQPLIPTERREEFVVMQDREKVGEDIQRVVETLVGDLKNLVEVETDGHKITIRLMGESTFDSGKAQIKDQMVPLLRRVGETLNETTGDIVIGGHTDNVPIAGGPFRSNLQLSIARAASVAEFLLANARIDPGRLATMGFGEYRPIADNTTPAGRQKNRRVEIVLTHLPPGSVGETQNAGVPPS